LGGWATRLPRLGDDFRPVAVVVCAEEPHKRPDRGVDLVATEYRGTGLTTLLAALRLSDAPAVAGPCPSDAAFPRWFALIDARGRWMRPGTPTDGCGNTRPEVIAAERRLTLTVTRRGVVRELLSARAAAAGCPQLAGDRIEQFTRAGPDVFDAPPDRVAFSGPVRFCVYRVVAEGLGDFLRGGVLPRVNQTVRPAAPCTAHATVFATLANAADEYRDGTATVQLDGCRQMMLELRAVPGPSLAQPDPALVATLSAP
jgi:hypothetical protein